MSQKKPRSMRLSDETKKLLDEIKRELEKAEMKVSYDDIIKRALKLYREKMAIYSEGATLEGSS